MSRAFTKEDGDRPEMEIPEADEDQGPELGPGVKNYITPEGAARLRGELHQLLTAERPRLVEVVSWAAGNGDRSENGDYLYGKRRLRQIDKRIHWLTKRLENSEVIDPAAQKSDRIVFGATVTVRDEDDRERTYVIVGADEIDTRRGLVSWTSPMGRALLKNREGDVVVLRTPRGEEELEIVSVRYVPLPPSPPAAAPPAGAGGSQPRRG